MKIRIYGGNIMHCLEYPLKKFHFTRSHKTVRQCLYYPLPSTHRGMGIETPIYLYMCVLCCTVQWKYNAKLVPSQNKTRASDRLWAYVCNRIHSKREILKGDWVKWYWFAVEFLPFWNNCTQFSVWIDKSHLKP